MPGGAGIACLEGLVGVARWQNRRRVKDRALTSGPSMKETSPQAMNTGAPGPSLADERNVGGPRPSDGILPIVGLGGSAGGIAALQGFLAATPVDSGMAFVVILHLSPHHESTLAEMFQRSTAMPVVAATNGVTVKPNSVYVIPPAVIVSSSWTTTWTRPTRSASFAR